MSTGYPGSNGIGMSNNMAILVLGLDDGEHLELPYTFGEAQEIDEAARLALYLFKDQIVYKQIEPENDFQSKNSNLEKIIFDAVIDALDRAEWRQNAAAALLGITTRKLGVIIDRYKINPPSRINAGWRKAR